MRAGLAKSAAVIVLGLLALGAAFLAVDVLDDRAASAVAHLASLKLDIRLTPLSLRRLDRVGEDFGVNGSGDVFVSLGGGFGQVGAGGAGLRLAAAPGGTISSLALDSAGHMLAVSDGYLGVLTSNPKSLHALVLPYEGARLAPSVRPGAVYLFGGAGGHQRLYRFTDSGGLAVLLDSEEPLTAVADTATDVYVATARRVVRLDRDGVRTVFQAPDDPAWGPLVSIALGPDGLLFVSTPSQVYAVLKRRALSIVNDSGGALRVRGDALHVLDRRRGLLYALSPATAAMFKGAG
jgi:hypothetical protein